MRHEISYAAMWLWNLANLRKESFLSGISETLIWPRQFKAVLILRQGTVAIICSHSCAIGFMSNEVSHNLTANKRGSTDSNPVIAWHNTNCMISTCCVDQYYLVFCMNVYLTRRDRDKMAAIFRRHIQIECMTTVVSCLKFHWNMFSGVQLTTSDDWCRWWFDARWATNHYLNQQWLRLLI